MPSGTPLDEFTDEERREFCARPQVARLAATPYEVLGRVPFPVITEEPYAVTLPPYGFLWFDLALEERQPQE